MKRPNGGAMATARLRTNDLTGWWCGVPATGAADPDTLKREPSGAWTAILWRHYRMRIIETPIAEVKREAEAEGWRVLPVSVTAEPTIP
jgi:hypothetical protein